MSQVKAVRIGLKDRQSNGLPDLCKYHLTSSASTTARAHVRDGSKPLSKSAEPSKMDKMFKLPKLLKSKGEDPCKIPTTFQMLRMTPIGRPFCSVDHKNLLMSSGDHRNFKSSKNKPAANSPVSKVKNSSKLTVSITSIISKATEMYPDKTQIRDAIETAISLPSTCSDRTNPARKPAPEGLIRNLRSPGPVSVKSPTQYMFGVGAANNSILIRKLLSSRLWWKDGSKYRASEDLHLDFYWATNNSLTASADPTHRQQARATSTNRLPGLAGVLGDKASLYRRLEGCVFLPLSFVFDAAAGAFGAQITGFRRVFEEKGGLLNVGMSPFLRSCDEAAKSKSQNGNSRDSYLYRGYNLWIAKPAKFNRGKGVELFTTWEQLEKILAVYSEGFQVKEFKHLSYSDQDQGSPISQLVSQPESSRRQKCRIARPIPIAKTPKSRQLLRTTNASHSPLIEEEKQIVKEFVVQKYVEKPLLFHGYKFDLRVLVAVCSNSQVLLCSESYVRLASLPYDPSNQNYYVHLTNNAVQSNSDSFGTIIKGNIFSSRLLDDYIQQNSSCKSIMDFRIGELIKNTVKGLFSNQKITVECQANADDFELFGLDFVLDEGLNLWLLEVNSNPSLSESNAYLSRFLHRALDDLLRVTVDRVFPPPAYAIQSPESIYPLSGISDRDNVWVPVCTL